MSKRISRLWINAATVSITMAMGMALGYVSWLGYTYEATVQTLRSTARQRMESSDAYPTEALAFLTAMNAINEPPCSEADTATFRQMLINARFVKEAGRMHGSTLACSAILPASSLPKESFQPLLRDKNGMLVYTKIYELQMGQLTPIVLRLGDAYVALDPSAHDITPKGMGFTLTVRDAPTTANHLGGNSTPVQGEALIKDGYGRVGDSLYATACSQRYPPCMTAVISMRQVLTSHRKQLSYWVVVGCAMGGWIGFIVVAFLRLRRGLEHQLRRAIRKDTLRVVYQPLVELKTGKVVGAEALVRWTDQDQVAVPPDMFIKVAEERGFVSQITELVIKRVLVDFSDVLRANRAFHINVNIAAADLIDPTFQRRLDGHLRQNHVSPQSLGIELTEGATARHADAIAAIAELRRRGHKVYIDDFGTGYSSLAYLKDLAVDGIKIDRAFTRAIGTDSVTVGILPHILSMAGVLKLAVVAEGVETEAQRAYYDFYDRMITGQGWLFGFPIAAEEFRGHWLNGSRGDRESGKVGAMIPHAIHAHSPRQPIHQEIVTAVPL